MTIPNDYLERVYAGVLGKLIGVYLGRPIENWRYDRIRRELGQIDYYVNEQLKVPLVVTDDDVAGTFTFLRALEDHGVSPGLTAEAIGKTWLNYIVEKRSILWWGGNGVSTEHTAWLNLKKGLPAPASGAIATNGQTVAEQIGAQIFIDGWAMVAPGQPQLAAALARMAGSVSHDGESVHAAMLWAAMEAEAFVSDDVKHLLEVGLSVIPADCLIARVIADVRRWRSEHEDWRATRQLIEEHHGYDCYPGLCHIAPNHALMIMALLYAPDDFQRAQMIVNTSGWDTDCNAGNLGCLMGIKLGLAGLDAGPDWRGPLADRMLNSSADGGSSINDAVRTAYYITNLGLRLAGGEPLASPKSGAQFHFSLPGSFQGFRAQPGKDMVPVRISNREFERSRALSIAVPVLGPGQTAALTTPTFAPPEVVDMPVYELMATPLVYPGQTLSARVVADPANAGPLAVRLRLQVYGADDALHDVDAEPALLAPGQSRVLSWTLPDLDGQPIGAAGLAFFPAGIAAESTVLLDYMRWDGAPNVTLARPKDGGGFWRRAWVNGVSTFMTRLESFRISQDVGEGLIIHGTREWTDYRLATELRIHLASYAGVAMRVQGLRRYYAARLRREGVLQIVRVRDDETLVLAEAPCPFAFDEPTHFEVTVEGPRLSAKVAGVSLEAVDDSGKGFADGGVGLLIADGALSGDEIHVGPVRPDDEPLHARRIAALV